MTSQHKHFYLKHDKNWALGPLNPMVINEETSSSMQHKCLDWVDDNSVIFMTFGTTTMLSDEVINEIAVGLEKSGQKFIWVLRDADKGHTFTDQEVRRSRLPERV